MSSRSRWSILGLGFVCLAAGVEGASDLPAVPFALVELYTSEGCSSCPPADALLSKLVDAARRDGSRVFALAFHVDYWNRLGWRDPFSDAAFSERQSMYAKPFEPRYTPQMVVNGVESFVGSDERRARRAIDAALGVAANVSVQATAEACAGAASRLAIRFVVQPMPRDARLHAAIVERDLASQVGRGENRGRTLHHDNVVRGFASTELPAGGVGSIEMELPADVRRDRAGVIVWVQETSSRRVLGATALDVVAAIASG
jgi:hypothetical protein